MLVGVIFLLIGMVMFYLVSERDSSWYRDLRFWLVMFATLVVIGGLTFRYYWM